MAFKPGESGNPHGRPKQRPFLEWCKKWTVEEAEKFLLPIASDSKRKDQLEAIKTIMAYGIGKPLDTLEASVQSDPVAANISEAPEYLDNLITGIPGVSASKDSGSPESAGDGTAPVLHS